VPILLQSKVVLVLAACALCDPENKRGEHEKDVLGNVGIAVVVELLRIVVEDVLQNQNTLDIIVSVSIRSVKDVRRRTILPATPPAIMANPMNKNNRALQTRPRISKSLLPFDSVFVDEVHDEKSEETEDAWHPIDEGDVHWDLPIRFISRSSGMCREHCCI
jgi:hypothetical protein